ncbi:MAG: F390 synthetase-related protein [Bacteriovoracia bacterium]
MLMALFHYLRVRYGRRFESRAQLEHWQEKRVLAHLKWVARNSLFYRARLAQVQDSSQGDYANWRQLPLMDKAQMMENFTELNTVGIDRDEAMAAAIRAENSRDFSPTLPGARGPITVGLSSGTSGNRGLFLVSSRERWQHAGTILARVLPRSLFGGHRVAFFLRANSNLYTASRSRWLKFEYFDLLAPLAEHLERLNAYQPTLLVGPPSLLRQLAEATQRGELKISPEKVVSVAEVLDPIDEAYLEKTFGKKVHQVYQCTEGFLGVTCREGRLHLNEDFVHIEKDYLDRAAGKFMPIITDFTRRSQPIVRYRLNDILTEAKEPCACGSIFTALEWIEGRADDLLYFHSASPNRPPVPVFPDFIRNAVMVGSSAVIEYQVRQDLPGQLRMALKFAAEANEPAERRKIEAQLEALAARIGARAPVCEVEVGFEARGLTKQRRIKRNYSEAAVNVLTDTRS